ncbi:MAG: asparagine synthase (glutamine-hydrolyzing) [Planctomycetota bacterium]|jgi:asparagine synthase (glutamine-hydrolysing)
MCGIGGFWLRPGAAPLERSRLVAARDRMAHRGPDDRGLVELEGGRVVLAHRRLSVQDLTAAGRQPMRLGARDLWITYNGEVYDFLDQRARLEGRGARFRSRTDTEVVLALYAELGCDVVSALRGMFAFALWDGERKRLLLARDRVGQKPLYYAETKRGLAFASTVAALLELGWVEPRLRDEVLPEYLALGRVGAPDTLLEGVHKLPPGHLLVVDDDGGTRLVRYYEPGFQEEERPDREERLAATLRESVRLRLISDVPVGVTLSGGVDSSLVAALAAERTELQTFTVSFEGEDEVDEAVYARPIAAHLNAQHHDIRVSAADVVAALPEVEAHIDEPHPNLVWLATYFVCRLAREHGVTVLLTGDGGDELFFGYRRWQALLRAYRRFLRPVERLPRPVRGLAARAVHGVVRDEAVRELFRRAARREPVYLGPMFFYPEVLADLLSPYGREVLRAHPPGARLAGLDRPADFRQWVRRVGLQGALVEDFLSRLDRMGMAVSVEGRAPLLDREVVDLALAWPSADLVRDGVGKAPLRRLVMRLFPRRLVERPKMGFCAPTWSWLRHGLHDLAADAVTGLADEIPLFDGARLARWASDPPGDRRDAGRRWALVSLARWWTRIRGAAPPRARPLHPGELAARRPPRCSSTETTAG